MAPLASLRTGYTTKSQPVLRWYISGPWPEKILFVLNEDNTDVTEPVLEADINGPGKDGIYRINLADHDVSLKPGVEYEWFIAIVAFPDERSGDFLGSATIKYVEPPGDLSERFKNTAPDKIYHEYAKQGYWYDAIDSLSTLIDKNPDDRMLRSHRIALCEQVSLGKVTDYDRKMLSARLTTDNN